MIFRNSSALDTARIQSLFVQHIDEWPHANLRVSLRNSRSSPFSGACYYDRNLIYVNVGRHLRYPYRVVTNIAPARSGRNCWWREAYSIEVPDAERLALFVFLHEFYHWLVRRARRNPRQKEGRCDRFAVRVLADDYGVAVVDSRGREVPRDAWDIQDLDGFVRRARGRSPREMAILIAATPGANVG